MQRNTLNFTKPALNSLTPPRPGKRETYHDTKVQGLQLRISGSGVKTFSVFRWIPGEARPERITLGRYPDLTPEQARGMAMKLIGDIARGENPAKRKRHARAELTLGEAFREYVTRHAEPHGKKTVRAMRETFERYLGDLPATPRKRHGRERTKAPGSVDWERRKLSSVHRGDVQRLHAELGRKVGHTTANRVLELLRAMFNRMIDWGLFKGENPASRIEKFRLVKRDRFVQGEELPQLFQAVVDEPNETIRDYVLISLLTGARKSNVLAMRWEEVSLERGEWRIPETKNGEPLSIPLTATTLEILKARYQQRASEYVFPGSGASGHLVSPKKAWARILKRAGIENLRLHDLRRSLGSWQAITGASLAVIGKSLGHKDVNSTAIYARLSQDPVREAMEKAHSAMLAAGGLLPGGEVLSLSKPKKTKAV